MTQNEGRQMPEPEQEEVGGSAEGSGQAEGTGRSDATPPGADPRIEDLREMEEKGDHLDEVIEDARVAVADAKRASSMRSPGTTGDDTEEQGPQASG